MTDSIGATPKSIQRAEVMSALRTASAKTGVGFDYLVKTAQRESNFDPGAKAGTSSATGLFQFTDATWLNMLDRYGDKHGVATEGQSRSELLALRKDASLFLGMDTLLGPAYLAAGYDDRGRSAFYLFLGRGF